jgi:hypothetical protein
LISNYFKCPSSHIATVVFYAGCVPEQYISLRGEYISQIWSCICKFHKWSFKYWVFIVKFHKKMVDLKKKLYRVTVILVFSLNFLGGEDFSFQLQFLSKWEALSFQFSFIRKKRITFLNIASFCEFNFGFQLKFFRWNGFSFQLQFLSK